MFPVMRLKMQAREAVTVNNGGNTASPITVTPTDDAPNHNTSYAVTFDGAKAAKSNSFDLQS